MDWENLASTGNKSEAARPRKDLKVWEHCTPKSGPQNSDPTSIKKQNTQQPLRDAPDPKSRDSTPGCHTIEREPPRKPQNGTKTKPKK
jgi:hypothetical protein